MQLTQTQIDELKSKGLTDDKIKAIAYSKGYSLPKESFGKSLIKSEIGFGQSIAGAVGSIALGKEKTALEEANQRAEQVQMNLLNRIREKRARGEDTTRLMNALKTMDKEVNFYDILNSSTGNSLNKSAKQVLGEGLGVATDIIGAGALPGGIGQATKATSFGSGVLKGAKAGATGGAIFGAAQGGARAMQEDKTGSQILGQTIGGGLAGGAVGGVIGGAIGGVSGAIAGRAEKVANKKENFVLDLVTPKTTKQVSEQAIKEGRVTEPGLFKRSQIIPSTRDYRLADAVDDFVSPKSTVLQNADSISKGVSDINTGVTNLIKQKKVPFNTNQLLSRLNASKAENKLIFASDATAERTYDAVVDAFVEHVKSKDTLGLFQARQSFDKIPAIRRLLESEGLGENVKRQIVLDVRGAANDYIASLLPKNNPYRLALRQETLMLEALGNIAEKNASTIGKNTLQVLTQKYPILKWLIGGFATGAVGAAGVGVGSAIIGSTD